MKKAQAESSTVTYEHALRMGAAALRRAAQQVAFDASRYTVLGTRDRAGREAFTQRSRALQAAAMLEARADQSHRRVTKNARASMPQVSNASILVAPVNSVTSRRKKKATQ